MAKIIGMPEINIRFTGLGASAMQRGEKGQALLVVKDENVGKPILKLYSIDDFTDEVQETFSEENVTNIKDALKGTPRELVIIRVTEGEGEAVESDLDSMFNPKSVNDAFKLVKTQADMNCWMAVADATKEETEDLVSFVKAQNKNNKKKYKGLVYQADSPDDKHIANFTTESIKYKNDDNVYSGLKFIPRLLGAIAGQSMDMSLIVQNFGELELVSEPEDMDEAVDNGELFLFNDEGGKIGIGRAVNSLTTTGQGVTDDMKFILIIEGKDLIYTDIYRTWNNNYKGRYKNVLDNQMLLVAAINAYFSELERGYILDPEFDNKVTIDTHAQKLANMPIFGEEVVNSWSENQILENTVGTRVFLRANIKIANAMEDLDMEIYM